MVSEAPIADKNSSSARSRRGNFSTRKDEVLRTAARLFSEYGFNQTRLEDVGEALHITRPALYRYAKSKDELVSLCIDIAADQVRDAVVAALRHQTGREQLVAFFRRYAEIMCDDFGRCLILVQRRREIGAADVERSRLGKREIDVSIREMVCRGAADGSLKAADPVVVSRALFGVFNNIPGWYRPGEALRPSQIAEDFLVLMLSGLAP